MNRSDRGWTRHWTSIGKSENGRRDDPIPEEFRCSASLVSNYETLLPATLDLKHFHHGSITRLDVPKNILIDFEGVIGRLFEEDRIRNGSDVCLTVMHSGRLGRRDEEIR